MGEPSCCHNGEAVSSCSFGQTAVTLSDCADITGREGTFYFDRGEKALPLKFDSGNWLCSFGMDVRKKVVVKKKDVIIDSSVYFFDKISVWY